MVFTLSEIKKYLQSQDSILDAIENLSESAIVDCISDTESLNYNKNEANLERYEMQIGMFKLKEEQLTLRRNSNGAKGKYWMALSPKWIRDESIKKQVGTEYEVRYWVNYGDNETYGWFTVEQIKLWLTTPELKLHTLGGSK